MGGSGRPSETVTTDQAARRLSPEETVIAYLQAATERDCATMIELVTEQSWQAGGRYATPEDAAGGCSAGDLLAATPTLTIEDVELTAEGAATATVTVTGTAGEGETQTLELILVQQDGEWKLVFPDGSGAVEPGQPPAGAPVPPGEDASTTTVPPAGGADPTTPAPPANPEEAAAAVNAFYEAMMAEDCGALVDATTAFFWGSVTDSTASDPLTVCSEAFANGDLSSNVVVDDITLDHQEDGVLTFAAQLMLDGAPFTEYLDVLQQAGAWKIDFLY